MGHKDHRMAAILERLNAVMGEYMSPLPSTTTYAHSVHNSSNQECHGENCFSTPNQTNTNDNKKYEDSVEVIKEHDNVFHDSWWQGGGGDQGSIHWEAAALGLASIFIGLGMVGLLMSICSACLRQRRAQILISTRSRKRAERFSSVPEGKQSLFQVFTSRGIICLVSQNPDLYFR